ncbi:protein shisa-9B [Gadus chalcogrammus]|uniref:protein shisa-9B n=1 Tax=Gadus chalcogrammus TaxID=1042646 RepID=UPI0024C3160C|nr:protein shisa-9B [Gadus chalcogrammus]
MRGTELLFGYFLVKVFVCDAEGEPGGQTLDGLIMESEFNDSKEDENEMTESPHTEDKCLGYYDVMGQWDPPFVCMTGSYLYCCGTCGFRFCCAFKSSRLDQSTCKNYDTPPWMMTGRPPPKKAEPAVTQDSSKDKTNLIVYIICGLVAILALAGIFTRLAIEKTRRPQRDHMQRVLAQVIRHPAPADPSDVMGLYGQHYENLATRTTVNHLQFNNVEPGSALLAQPYPALGQRAGPYEEERPGSDMSSYATLKAVAEKSNESHYTNRHLLERATKGNLPMEPVDMEEPEPSNPYSPLKRSSTTSTSAPTGHKGRSSKTHSSCSSLGAHYGTTTTTSSNVSSPSTAHPDVLKGWDGRHSGHRYAHAQKKHSHSAEKELLNMRYNMPPQPYFVTNSKTEVTV